MPANTFGCDFDWKASPFSLPSTPSNLVSLEQIEGPNGTLVMFICNHYTYVLDVLNDIISGAHKLIAMGVGVVAISSNDATAYPADSFEHMRRLALSENFPFHYLYDESQSVARAYGATFTPDFFGCNAHLELNRGLINNKRERPSHAKHNLFDAMSLIRKTGKGPLVQHVSIGCSIKWK